ncbi:hypothetical protein HAX54_022820 [Datura stramonium]|uniref:Uncharacterized protein n=1 Tax=Datura stramonium TaxID=4076 RepID=A0ABS8UV73_DATST|nr:hypothetical protein [Datura stramonium]
MLNRVLQNQEEEEATLRNKTNVVSAHKESFQSNCHMSRIFDQDKQSTINFDDSLESNEEESFGYRLEITTRSGKVLHTRSDIPMEEEINFKEELCSNIGLAHEKVIDDTSIKEVDEKPKEFSCISVLDELDDMEEMLDPNKEKGDSEGVLATILGTHDLIEVMKEHGEAVKSLEGLVYYSCYKRVTIT